MSKPLLILAIPFLASACASESPELGKQLYMAHCSECHSEDGRGDPRQRGLYPALDLTGSEMVAKEANGIIYRRIANGYGSMPGFSHKLEHQDLLRLTEYTLNFKQPAEE